MILHTIVSEYDIFYNPPDENTCCSSVNGRFFECEKSEKGMKIRRIISTDLYDYLNPSYELGGYLQESVEEKNSISPIK